MKILPSEIIHRIETHLRHLYGDDRLGHLSARLTQLLGHNPQTSVFPLPTWNQNETLLALFADSVTCSHEKPLITLDGFLQQTIGATFSTLHLLPFYPADSGDEYSVIDHRTVDPSLGDWADIERLAGRYRLMFDLVLGHVSARSVWFKDYIDGISPPRGYFLTADPDAEIDQVESPCGSPVFTCVHTRRGERRLWSTFGCNQFDLNFANPDVLFEFLEIILEYLQHGARLLQLDDVPYLWKDPVRGSVDLPEDHELVKLLRGVLTASAPEVLLLADVPIRQSQAFRYFGSGDESQLLYTHALGGLLVHGLLSGQTVYLNRWLESLPDPPPGCTFINQTDGPNGLALKPLEDCLPHTEIALLQKWLSDRGGLITHYRCGASKLPYEANISYFDALAATHLPLESQYARLLCAQTIALSLRGMPGIYFPSLTAAPTDHARVEATGHIRAVNRYRWQQQTLNKALTNPSHGRGRLFAELLRRVRLRRQHPAFHPDGQQSMLAVEEGLLAFRRTAPDNQETVAVVSNLTGQRKQAVPENLLPDLIRYPAKHELLTGQPLAGRENHPLELAPYQTLWIAGSAARSSE